MKRNMALLVVALTIAAGCQSVAPASGPNRMLPHAEREGWQGDLAPVTRLETPKHKNVEIVRDARGQGSPFANWPAVNARFGRWRDARGRHSPIGLAVGATAGARCLGRRI